MPISIETSPTLASDEVSVTTASFTRPAGGLLVATASGYSSDPLSVSGGGLTWTRRIQRTDGPAFAEIWTAPCPTSGSTTVTAAITGEFNGVGLKVDAITGQHSTDPIGATGSGTSSTNNLTVNGYTSTAANSRGWFAGVESSGLGTPTSTDTGFGWLVTVEFGNNCGISVRKSADTPAAGSSVAFNADAGGSGSAGWKWVALEIKPDLGSRIRAVLSRSAVHRAASW